tara:strand:+ start:302 stop:457 length:156 start_codon:yes stop_codon:yes gene_type:complete
MAAWQMILTLVSGVSSHPTQAQAGEFELITKPIQSFFPVFLSFTSAISMIA